ncbi:anthranilate synthase component I [Pseudohyphozyma bogoriensis]|nr:anthranilate synthase component I [Pseudohyphozyma bogoriensis]
MRPAPLFLLALAPLSLAFGPRRVADDDLRAYQPLDSLISDTFPQELLVARHAHINRRKGSAVQPAHARQDAAIVSRQVADPRVAASKWDYRVKRAAVPSATACSGTAPAYDSQDCYDHFHVNDKYSYEDYVHKLCSILISHLQRNRRCGLRPMRRTRLEWRHMLCIWIHMHIWQRLLQPVLAWDKLEYHHYYEHYYKHNHASDDYDNYNFENNLVNDDD